MKKTVIFAFIFGTFLNLHSMLEENFIRIKISGKQMKKTLREIYINTDSSTTSKQPLTRGLTLASRLCTKSEAYLKTRCSQSEIKKCVYIMVKREFSDLSANDLCETLRECKRNRLPEAFIEALLLLIVERTKKNLPVFSSYHLTDKEAMFLMRHYYLKHNQLVKIKNEKLQQRSLRFSLNELFDSKKITPQLLIKETKSYFSQNWKFGIILDLSNLELSSLDGIEKVIELVDVEAVIKLDLHNNYLNEVPHTLISTFPNLRVIDFSNNLSSNVTLHNDSLKSIYIVY